MSIGEVIRHYRKAQNLTQEEVARRLGVTPPAVNKWEHGASLPDIALLAPLARLLGISCDTLLAYKEDLTPAEISNLCRQAGQLLEQQDFAAVQAWAQKQMAEYPNCEQLTLNLAILLEVRRVTHLADTPVYDEWLIACFSRLLGSNQTEIRRKAAEMLLNMQLRRADYARAEKYLTYFPAEDFERQYYQALIYSQTGQTAQAWQAYEQLLFSAGNRLSLLLHQLYSLARQEADCERAQMLAEKQAQLAALMEMGAYHAAVDKLDFVVWQQDAAETVRLMELLLNTEDGLCAYIHAPLYAHMQFKPPAAAFLNESKAKLLARFGNIDEFAYLKQDAAAFQRWQKLAKKFMR